MGPKVVRCLAYTLQVRPIAYGCACWGSPACGLVVCVWDGVAFL